jgi:uncharacterized protein (DUF983 family)
MTTQSGARPSLVNVAIQGRCPRCGQGSLFIGYLQVGSACTACGLSFTQFATEDGPASLIILPLCMLTAGGSLGVEMYFQPALWVHAVLWPTFIALVVGLALRPVKAGVIALQYRHRSRLGQAFEAGVLAPPVGSPERLPPVAHNIGVDKK